jgi:hypothetical protein
MKFYVTTEGVQKLKRSFLNLKLFSIIHVPEILEKYNYTYESIDNYGSFIVSNKINDLIIAYSKSKRIRGIIYSNPIINEELIPNLFDSLKDLESITEIVLLDDYNLPKLKHLYNHFDEIIFFPSIKKIRLIEAKNIEKMSKWTFNPREEKN